MSAPSELAGIPANFPPLIRTSFEHEQDWESLLHDLKHQYLDPDLDYDVVTIIDDHAYEGMTPGEIIARARSERPDGAVDWDFCLVADGYSLTTSEHPVLAVPADTGCHTFRVCISDVAEVVLPVAFGTLGWEHYTDLDENGVMRPLNSRR